MSWHLASLNQTHLSKYSRIVSNPVSVFIKRSSCAFKNFDTTEMDIKCDIMTVSTAEVKIASVT